MKDDSTIQAVRNVRHEISKEHGHNVQKIIEYYKIKQEDHSDRLIDSKKNVESQIKDKLAS